MPRICWLSAALCVALLTPSLVRAQTPTLGEIALKEQERRKTLKAGGKILTNQDLPRPAASPPAAATPAPSTQGAADEKPAAKLGAKPAEAPKDEVWWRQRLSQAREELRRHEMFAEALQTRVNALTNDFANRDDPYQRVRVAEDRAKALLEMDRVKADIALNRKGIADIEEEARRAGVPPGWLR